jgi:DNA-binding NarL/FixJ family response regulator
MIKILLVDDHQIIREGIKALLHNHKDFLIIGECDDGNEVDEFLKNTLADVVLMDINMPQMDGIQCTELITKKYQDIKVLALSMHNEERFISRIIEAGAYGYVLKDSGKKQLVEAIMAVSQGENYYDKEVTSILMSRYMKNTPDKQKTKKVILPELTPREIEILKLIAEELTNVEISEKLFISQRTVDTHRRNLLQKLGVKNTVGLIRYAFQSGLIE